MATQKKKHDNPIIDKNDNIRYLKNNKGEPSASIHTHTNQNIKNKTINASWTLGVSVHPQTNVIEAFPAIGELTALGNGKLQKIFNKNRNNIIGTQCVKGQSDTTTKRKQQRMQR